MEERYEDTSDDIDYTIGPDDRYDDDVVDDIEDDGSTYVNGYLVFSDGSYREDFRSDC